MTLKIVGIVSRAPVGSRLPPVLCVHCPECGARYRRRGWPKRVQQTSMCVRCAARKAQARRKANEARPGVWGMRCSDG